MNSPVQQIKERLAIEEIVSSYIKLEKAGANFKAKCPFHNEKTASFFISPVRGNYYCFGCGAKGDIFTFVEEFEGLDFKGALKVLATKAGVVLEEFNRKEVSEKERLYQTMEEASKFFVKNLDSETKILNYLKDRGLEKETIEDFKIGFARLEWRDLYNHLVKMGFKDGEIEKAGLAKKTEKGMYDRFRGRIIFPIRDSGGRIIAFSGRIFEPCLPAGRDDGKSAKYLNSPETPIFNKSSVLYGLDRAKDSIRKNNFSILVEGQFDLILSHQAGFRNTVATSGTALSDSTISKASLVDDERLRENVVSNLGLIRRLSPNIVLAFDADKAGVRASERASKIALSFGMDVKVAELPEGVDPADLISKNGVESWRKAIRNSKHIIEFILNRILKNYKENTRKAGREIKEKLLPYINSIESSIEKAHFIKKISDESGIPEEALKEDLEKVEQDSKYEQGEIRKVENSENKIFRRDYILRRILGIILWQKTLPKENIDTSKILSEISSIVGQSGETLLSSAKGDAQDLIFEAEVFYEDVEKLSKDIAELVANFEEEYLKEELSKKIRELQGAEKDSVKSSEILKKINDISNKIQDIKNGRLGK